MDLTSHGQAEIAGPGYAAAVITEAGDRLIWSTTPVNEGYLLVEGYPHPIKGNVMILGPEGADGPTVDLEWIGENVDFGTVQQTGPIRMFRGERTRREVKN